jgi:hypothetical protein
MKFDLVKKQHKKCYNLCIGFVYMNYRIDKVYEISFLFIYEILNALLNKKNFFISFKFEFYIQNKCLKYTI